MFTEALFTIDKIWKQCKYPSIGKWIKKLYIYIHMHICVYIPTDNGILLSHKMSETFPSRTTWMDLEGSMLNEISQKKKAKYHIISLIHGT